MEESRNPDSLWRHYFGILPREFTNFPPFWSPEEKKMYEESRDYELITMRLPSLIVDYRRISEVVPEFANEYSVLEFIEMKLLVKSRTFGLSMNDEDDDKMSGAIPWADSYNHGPGSSWGYKVKEDGRRGFFITAK